MPTEPVQCPRCRSTDVRALLPIEDGNLGYKCRQCQHIWYDHDGPRAAAKGRTEGGAQKSRKKR